MSAFRTGGAIHALHDAMRRVQAVGASDLHLKAGSAPIIRLNGELTTIPGSYALSDYDMEEIVHELSREVPDRLSEFEKTGECDLAYSLEGCGRFRVNVFRQRGQIGIALRVISDVVPKLEKLNLPPVISTLAQVPRGLILVTGATGSGKTTTLAGMIDLINETESRHVVTIEDPIEILHRDKRSIVNQREVGNDTPSFGSALRRALRQDPDVILVGEMRDEETVRTALSAAETGHLVFSTLHTIDVMESIYRVLDFFPPELERQARAMLAGTLKGIVSQRLIRTAGGRSRVPAIEVMVATNRVTDCILRPEDTPLIRDAIAEGGYYGMQSFDQSLLQLVLDRTITVEEAMFHATSKQNFALLLEANAVMMDRELRKRASGSMISVNEEVDFDRMRHGQTPVAPPPPMTTHGVHPQNPPMPLDQQGQPFPGAA